MRPCSKVTTSLSVSLWPHTHTYVNVSQVLCQLVWSHCTSNCDGFCDFTHRSRGVCVWKVNTVGLLHCCGDTKPIFQPEVSVKSVLLCELWCRRAGSPAAADTTAAS